MGRLPVLLVWLVFVAASSRVAPTAAAAVTANSNGDRETEGHSQPLVGDQPPAGLEESALGLAAGVAAAAVEEEYSPIGLQIWPDEDSLLRALDGGRLVLVIIHAPWCHRDGGMGRTAALAADLVDATFQQLSSDASLPPRMSKPVIGTMEDAVYDGLSESLGPVTHYPALKFVLTSTNRTAVGTEEEGEAQVEIWDFLGPRETAKDLHDAVLMYWYRFVMADAMGNGSREPTPPVFTFSSQQQMATFLQSHGERFLGPSPIRRRVESKVESEISRLYMGQDDVGGVFHTHDLGADDARTPCNPPRKKWRNKGDEGLRDCGERGEYVQEIDPFTLLVQCRKVDWGTVDLDGIQKMSDAQTIHLDNQRRAQNEFAELADEYFHRKDVAFFSLNTTMHDDETEFGDSPYCGGLFDDVEGAGNGAVAFLRARRYAVYSVSGVEAKDQQKQSAWSHRRRRVIHKVTTDWSESPHAVFVPSATEDTVQPPKKIPGKATNDSPAEYVQSNLVASAVVHTTPTVMWYDRDRMAQLAFSWYRKTHAVLFVDIALAHKAWSPNHHANNAGRLDWPSSITHSMEAEQLLLDHQRAIQLFYNAALHHRVKRPPDDVVFLIVPSTEVRILTTFGIDIWTPLDEALVQSIKEAKSSGEEEEIGQCTAPAEGRNHTLPVMMITDSSGRYGMQSSRHYLPAEDIFSSSFRSSFDEGGAIGDFVDGFFSGTLGSPFARSEGPQPEREVTVEPNVTVLTGNTFDALVMDRADEHTMLLIQASTCGHCKRFSIFWNDLASLVQSMNWGSVIKVLKIDVAKNDVPLDARDLPSVYYFPAGEKGNPIEMTPRMNRTIPQNDYDEGLGWVKSGLDILEWMIAQGKLNLDDLSGKAGLDVAQDDTRDVEDEENAAGSESPPEDSWLLQK
ncbi:hypothetical protein ACHAXT_009918 [Thalassiosira profunda]